MTASTKTTYKRNKNGTNPCQCLVRTGDPGTTVWTYKTGCGKLCTGEFAQGHDAKYKSELIKAYRAGVDMDVSDAKGIMHTTTATHLANARGWGHFLTTAKPKKAKVAKLVPGDSCVVKIGRWVKKGVVDAVVGDQFIVEYEAGGELRSVAKPMSEVSAA